MIVRINGKELVYGHQEAPVVWLQETPGRTPIYVVAAAGLGSLIPAYQGIATILAEAVICFAGTAWMFGHRTEAIEKLIGAAAGLLIILQAHNIVVWLKGLLA